MPHYSWQVGQGDTNGGPSSNDHYCWMRPEDIDYDRPVTECHSCSDLASEMAAALASVSVVFKDNKAYSQKLVHGAKTLFKFSRDQRGRYSSGNEAALFYNSTSYWDEFVWGAAWMHYATGNSSYLQLATTPGLAKHAGAFWGGPYYGVLSWDNKIAGAQIDYILGKNPRKMSYVVGFGNHHPKHVHHRRALIPRNKIKHNCKGGWKWRDSSKPNPNTIVGAMVAGPDRHDGFHDLLTTTIQSPPMFPTPPPPPPPAPSRP